MQDMGIVYGSEVQAKPLVIGKDTVYVHSEIEQTEDNLYKYHEVQYDKDEYLTIIAEKNQELEKQLIATQLALCETFEDKGGE